MNFFTRYNPPPSPAADIGGRSMTHQEFKAECDINNIVKRVGLGLTQLQCPEPVFTDISEVPTSYEEMLQVVLDAQARFDSMPSRVRERFGNDPARLVKFLSDESNFDEALKLGLVNARGGSPSSLSNGSEPPKSNNVNVSNSHKDD